jgi:heat shock protein HslJ
VSGRSFCNYYTGIYALAGKNLSIRLTTITTMACFPQTKEKLFTDLLAAVNGFEIDSKGTLTLHATNGSTITARRE